MRFTRRSAIITTAIALFAGLGVGQAWLQSQANYPPTGDDTWMQPILDRAYGTQFLTPTAEPMFFVSPTLRPSPGSFGRRDAGKMRSLVAAQRT